MVNLIDIVLMGLLLITAFAIVRMRDLFAIVMLFSIYSLASASFFVNLDAVDVALTEAAVGAGISTVLMLGTLAMTRRHEERRPRQPHLLPLFIVAVTGAVLIYGTLDMPHFADPAAPIHQHVVPRYIEQSGTEIGIPNIVASILASYRGFDTLGETAVVFTAGLGVLTLLGRFGRREELSDGRSMYHDMILRVIGKALVPLMLLFALYVQFHGELGPGGGFQAGVVAAAAFILYSIVFGWDRAQKIISPFALNIMMACGVSLYALVGVAGMLLGGEFLNYNVLGSYPAGGQHLGIFLVELGVGITVAAVMLSIYFDFAARLAVRKLEGE